jgi:tryptophan synthase beta chain
MMKRKRITAVFLAAAVLAGFCIWQNNDLTVSRSQVVSGRIPAEFDGYTILQVSDLHNKEFGKGQRRILSKIAEEEPDVMIACAGGGSNFAGSLFPFIKDKIDGNSDTQFIAVEPTACPTLTQGSYDYDFGDSNGFTPMLKMFTLGHDFVAPSVHAGGLRYHGMSPIISLLTKEGYIQPMAVHQRDCFEAGITFARNEGILPAPETTHAIRAAIDEAIKCKETGEEKTIVLNFSGHGMLDLKGYASYFAGTMQNAK